MYSDWTPDDGQRKCPKHVAYLHKNKFGEISASDDFIKKKFFTMHGHMNTKKYLAKILPTFFNTR